MEIEEDIMATILIDLETKMIKEAPNSHQSLQLWKAWVPSKRAKDKILTNSKNHFTITSWLPTKTQRICPNVSLNSFESTTEVMRVWIELHFFFALRFWIDGWVKGVLFRGIVAFDLPFLNVSFTWRQIVSLECWYLCCCNFIASTWGLMCRLRVILEDIVLLLWLISAKTIKNWWSSWKMKTRWRFN